ncbi:MAG: DUF2971 domain-containing protein [Methanococcoides sp.]|nr:DUF2971 domain-containing protein [Methanococcoides sp.]
MNYCYKGDEKYWCDFFIRAGVDPTKVDATLQENINKGILEKNGNLFILDPANEIYRNLEGSDLHGDVHSKNLPLVACFTEKDDSILMWSHYANNHQGICLRFKAKPALDCHYLLLNSKQIPLMKVQYNDDLPDDVNMANNEERIDQIPTCLLTKFSDWEYENEYRILRFEDEFEQNNIMNYEKQDLEGIVFGLKVNKKDAQDVYETIRENYINKRVNVNFYEAKEIRNKYAIQVEKIDDMNKYLDSLV